MVSLAFFLIAFCGYIFSQAEEADAQPKQQQDSAPEETSPKPKKDPQTKNPFPNRIKAPGLEGGTGWLNTSGEITLKDLRGKVVLLDFWTYCCINCMHVLPDLEYLEEKYDRELVVIGVHSAKFENEKEIDNIRQAVIRYEIEHPVINDSKMTLWRKFGARAWPTMVLIDPEGYYCGYISGEGHREVLDKIVGKLVGFHEAKGTLDRTPVQFDLERDELPPTPLRYPGKVLAHAPSDRLFIADSNHNRIIIANLDGKLLDIVGTGRIGKQNGPYDRASFDHPQGMELVGNTLYVADTENHLIRAIDLEEKRVKTLAGTGKKARFRAPGGRLRHTDLNSPWALLHLDRVLYVAMAGPHQVWSHELGSNRIGIFAGSGREDILDGPLNEAALAQTSGMATDGESIYIVDSEGSAVRKITRGSKGRVSTIAGASDLPNGRSLFEFGDTDGKGGKARLQHPLGIVYRDGHLYVADSYNHKIKKIKLENSMVSTFLGTGKPGKSLDPAQFSEPGGLALAHNKLYVADTNNHRLCMVDLKTKEVSELKIQGLEPPQPPSEENNASFPEAEAIQVSPQKVAPGENLKFTVSFNLPEGYKLNQRAPVTYRLTTASSQALIPTEELNIRNKAEQDDSKVTISVPLSQSSGQVDLQLSLSYTFCRGGVGGLCKLDTAHWKIPVEVTNQADQTSIQLTAGDNEPDQKKSLKLP